VLQPRFRYEFDADSGELGARHTFARTSNDAFPDGACVDAEGCVWSAHWGAAQVVRYTPEGDIDLVLRVPARQPSCVAFGGPARDLLLVTSAREGLSETELDGDPAAGHLFVFRTAQVGLKESRYRVLPAAGAREATLETSCASQSHAT
jgi:L-arabinonolactonase